MPRDAAEVELTKALHHMRRIRQFEEAGDSDIQQLYHGAVVFITGGTGFLGKQLLEKLLRACQGIEKIYLLHRNKKGVPVAERLAEQLKDPVYDEVRKINPEFEKKIITVEGDVTDLRLGIRTEDWSRICEETNFIFHAAATVRFDDPLKKSIITNVRGTRELISLARECAKLRALVYVSTAYANCNRSTSVEKFYPSPVPPNVMIDFAETVDEARIDSITSALISGWPNTYTFSKAIAEDLVRAMGQGLPICIVRPPIVTPTYREPVPGWLDQSNCYGPSGMILGIGLGVLRTFHISTDIGADVVPLDFVNNLVVAAAWETVQRRAQGELGIKIYTLSRKRNVALMEHAHVFVGTKGREFVSPRTIWYCYCFLTSNRRLFQLYTLFLHLIPAFFVDIPLALTGQKIRLTKIYKTIYKANNLLSFFISQWFLFHDDNTLALYNKMSIKDQEIFTFDVKKIDMDECLAIWCIGIRKYIVRDGLKGTAIAVKRQFWFKILNFIVISLYFWLMLKILFWLYSSVVFTSSFVLESVCK